MTEESKYQIYTEVRGQYVIVTDKRWWSFTFPQDASLEENVAIAKEIVRGLEETIAKIKESEAAKDKEATAEIVAE